MGCVLPAGLGQAPARQASLQAPASRMAAGCTTLNKVCGSGMKAVMLAHDIIKAGSASTVVAGGMESMTNAPHLLNGSRTGIRFGAGELVDHMAWDGLTNPDDGKAMGVFGDAACAKYGYDRAAVDAYAAESVRRAQAAQASGAFDGEIAAVTVKTVARARWWSTRTRSPARSTHRRSPTCVRPSARMAC
jgi:acetyl-CoA C-acetyltransferase